MLSMSSESESVLMCLWASASSDCLNSGVLIRLPFYLNQHWSLDH